MIHVTCLIRYWVFPLCVWSSGGRNHLPPSTRPLDAFYLLASSDEGGCQRSFLRKTTADQNKRSLSRGHLLNPRFPSIIHGRRGHLLWYSGMDRNGFFEGGCTLYLWRIGMGALNDKGIAWKLSGVFWLRNVQNESLKGQKVAVCHKWNLHFTKNVHAYYKGGSHADSLRVCIWSAKP